MVEKTLVKADPKAPLTAADLIPPEARGDHYVAMFDPPSLGEIVIFRALTHQFAFQGAKEYPAIVTHIDKEGGVFVYALSAFHSPIPIGPLPHQTDAPTGAAACWVHRAGA